MFRKASSLFRRSLSELTITQNMVLCGLMAALAVVLNTFASISVGPYLKIGFSGYPNRIVEFLFGPATGMFFGAALDIIKFMLKPDGIFNPIYTLIAMISGLGGGFILYRRKPSLPRVFASQLYLKLFINVCLNSLAMYITMGNGVLAMMPTRIIKNLIQLPVDTLLLYSLFRMIELIAKRYHIGQNRSQE